MCLRLSIKCKKILPTNGPHIKSMMGKRGKTLFILTGELHVSSAVSKYFAIAHIKDVINHVYRIIK